MKFRQKFTDVIEEHPEERAEATPALNRKVALRTKRWKGISMGQL